MRAWDNHNSYLDNDGNLLHGKIRFCKKATTDNVAIYNRDGVALRNPAFTDMLGRTEYQVFLNSDADVTAYYYKYIGTGDMMTWQGEDYDPSRWSYQYSSDSMDPSKIVDLTATTADGVATMTDLRAKDPETVPTVNGAKLLWLYGYYSAGDKPPVLYYWDSASLKNDDGGAVIMHNNTSGPGRWILASNDLHFDVRHFGVFPQSDKYSVDYSYTSQLANCGIYIDNCGLDAWFPDNNGAMSYYLMDGSNTFSITGDIYASDGVRFMCKTGTTTTAIQCHELHKATPYLFDDTVQVGTGSFTADTVRMSWVASNINATARKKWIIDTNEYARSITGKEVVFETNGKSTLVLDNCVIRSDRKITGDISISNVELRTDWFQSGYPWSRLSGTGNVVLLKNCDNADIYIELKNKYSESDYGDLGGATVTDANLEGSNIVIANFEGSAILPDTDAIVRIDRFSGTLTRANSAALHSLYLRDSSIIMNGTLNYMVVSAKSTALSAAHETTMVVSHSVDFEDSSVGFAVNCNGDCYFVRSEIGAVLQSSLTTAMNTVIDNCNLLGQYVLNPTVANTIFTGRIVNNTSVVTSPVVPNKTYFADADSAHSYVYANNSGSFYPDVSAQNTFTAFVKYLYMGARPENGGHYRWLYRSALGTNMSMWNTTTNFDQVNFFRIGKDRFPVLAKLVAWEADPSKTLDTDSVSYMDVYAAAYPIYNNGVIDNLLWGIKPYWTDPSAPDSEISTKFNNAFFRGLASHSTEWSGEDYDLDISIQYENLATHG